jgi:arginyl-tRNA synthetase
MSNLAEVLSDKIQTVTGIDPELRPATKAQFGHFQSNVALRLAKAEGNPPREVAARIVSELDIADICLPAEIAGPGFINFTFTPEALAVAVSEQLADERGGIVPAEKPLTVVVDYSSPNVAKQMHVGHLRSTIIGDCFARVLSALGHKVIRQNHIGDWGRQFGMLIEQIKDENLDLTTLDLPNAELLYKRANEHLEADAAFADRARARVVALQAGDEETLSIWRRLIEISIAGFDQTYARMNVLLGDGDYAGESSYNDLLAGVCDDLEARGIAVHDQGALVVFVPGFDAPAILRNSAGGYGYDVTDVAALKHRVEDFGAQRLIYTTDARQSNHFKLFFEVCKIAGYLPPEVQVQHIGFGMVLGRDGKPFKTREGGSVHLNDLLDTAEECASPEIALAAIKYADLSNQLQKDYVFDAERMVLTNGDTGPYLQYAHARVSRILRNAAAEGLLVSATPKVTVLAEYPEQDLALNLTRFGEIVALVAAELTPHKLCIYLFELAGKFSTFYEQCQVLKSEGEVRDSRLALCQATKQVLATGLNLLGIAAPDSM